MFTYDGQERNMENGRIMATKKTIPEGLLVYFAYVKII